MRKVQSYKEKIGTFRIYIRARSNREAVVFFFNDKNSTNKIPKSFKTKNLLLFVYIKWWILKKNSLNSLGLCPAGTENP